MNIIIYGTKQCHFCQKVKDYFKEKNLQYEYIDIGVDFEKAKEMMKLTNAYSVPTILINGKVCIGWNQSRLNELLEE
jgi:glutaredoxin